MARNGSTVTINDSHRFFRTLTNMDCIFHMISNRATLVILYFLSGNRGIKLNYLIKIVTKIVMI
jgi:hypothetical protein